MPYLPKPKRRQRVYGKPLSGHNTRRQRDHHDEFYNTTTWRRIRKQFIEAHPICKWCDEENKTTQAEVVDHITPIKQGGDMTNINNLQSLCTRCHAQKSAWEARRSNNTNKK